MKYWEHIPPVQAMLAVEATARLGSFSKAASDLNVTQAAIRHLMAQAEDFLCTALFVRQARRLQLICEGRRYVDAIVSGLNIIWLEGESLQRASKSDTLTVSCNLGYANYLASAPKKFQDLHPNVTVNVVTAYQELPTLAKDIDMSVRFGNGGWPECTSHLLFAEEIVPVASASYAKSIGRIESPEELLKLTLLHARADDKTWFNWKQWFRRFGVTVSGGLPGPVFDNHLMMMQAARAGGGIALGWIGTASEQVRRGQLVELLPEKIAAGGGVYLVSRAETALNKTAALFANWLMSMPRPTFGISWNPRAESSVPIDHDQRSELPIHDFVGRE
ncbi:LysR substrate-binding domain-containing protein [Mesorhizobium sp. M1334]|uniref:LysR substrate-binding domain-containing protein n=1 Tax=Mesorhizobium sp. M1334 TaxID=2957084 RepID=UPI00333B9136